MKSAIHSKVPIPRSPERRMKPVVHGVMAYEDMAIAKLAKEKWDYMVGRLQYGYDFELRLWKFDILRIPELRQTAVHDAAGAHLVFVATHGAGDLPVEVKTWINLWLARLNRNTDDQRLLVYLPGPPPQDGATFDVSQFA